MNVTVTEAGEPCTPLAVIVRCPVYVLGRSAPTEAETCKIAGAVPLNGETLSHGESDDAVKFSDPLPALVTFSVALGGSEPPWVAAKESVAGETERIGVGGGGGGATTRLAVTVAGEPCVPAERTVTLPV